jgi:hypothetical protein
VKYILCMILHTDETGEVRWAVVFEGFQEFWLNSFWTYDEAITFCARYDLTVKETVEQLS